MKLGMKKWCLSLALALSLPLSSVRAVDITWDGGNGKWSDAKWGGGNTIDAFVGQLDGSSGWGHADGEEEVITITGASVVSYDANDFRGDGTGGSDFRMKQGSALYITSGAKWQQVSTDDWTENRWTEMDLSRLVLDGGTFSRVGHVNDEGGGAFAFGSWRGDDNFSDPDTLLPYEEILIDIKNGGRLENEGQLNFGLWGDTQRGGTTITMTINDGTVDLTGGDVIPDDSVPYAGDLIFANPFTSDLVDDQPNYAINFVGPGSITVDHSGVVSAKVDDFGAWINTDPISWQDLWDEGILQANGKSGKTGATFSAYFTVTGVVGQDNYKVEFKSATLPGDFNKDGVLTVADINLLSAAVRGASGDKSYDVNGDNAVDNSDREYWVNSLQKSYIGDSNFDGMFNSDDLISVFIIGKYEDGVANNAGYEEGDWDGNGDFESGDFVAAFVAGGYDLPGRAAVAAVPEPASLGLLAVGGLMLGMFRRR